MHNSLLLGEEEFQLRAQLGREIDTPLLQTHTPAGSIGREEGQQHVAEFLSLHIGIVSSRPPGESVEFLVIVIDRGLVDLSCLLADCMQAAAGHVFRFPFSVFRFSLIAMVMEGMAMAPGTIAFPCPEKNADGGGDG